MADDRERSGARHIVAMGGGGFRSEPGNPLLDQFVLGLVPALRPRVCFLATASGDDQGYICAFYAAFARKTEATHVTLFRRTVTDLRAVLLNQDIICVGGGGAANMLALWRVHGVDAILREAWEEGAVLTGMSAGASCWFQGSITDSFGPLAPLHDGLGFLRGSFCPHYDSEPGRPPLYRIAVASQLGSGYAADDGVALHFVDTSFAEAVSSRPEASAYRVEPGAETPLAVRFLG